ncbi:MAG: CBS domain-containing protein [Robiginitomaculum sp.]|nr:CBS domain-containing protein [Robiginitomaculum sp.]
MSVSELLKNKGNAVYAVRETATLRDAITLLNAKNIGVVLVTDKNGHMKGILSERDIIRKALTRETGDQEAGFRDELVTKTMTSKVFSVDEDASIDAVMEIMTNSRIRHVPVLDGDKIMGLVSIGDVVKRKISDAENEAAVLRDYIATG